MIFKRTFLIFSMIASSGMLAMERLPGDIVRNIAKSVLNAPNLTDSERAFGLQSLASLNHHWNTAMSGLTRADFPYQCQQATA